MLLKISIPCSSSYNVQKKIGLYSNVLLYKLKLKYTVYIKTFKGDNFCGLSGVISIMLRKLMQCAGSSSACAPLP